MRRNISLSLLLIVLCLLTVREITAKDTYENDITPLAGERVDFKVYVNEREVKTPVYENKTKSRFSRSAYSLLVDMQIILNELALDFEWEKPDTLYIRSDQIENVRIIMSKSIQKNLSKPTDFGGYREYDSNLEILTIDDRVFAPISTISYLFDGSLKLEDNEIYLYSKDFIRLDIPATLEECFKQLDEELSESSKNKLKELPLSDLNGYHFGLGLWIRNNWLYPTELRIAKQFTDRGVKHRDDMSGIIIRCYHEYLNNKEVSIDDIDKYRLKIRIVEEDSIAIDTLDIYDDDMEDIEIEEEIEIMRELYQ